MVDLQDADQARQLSNLLGMGLQEGAQAAAMRLAQAVQGLLEVGEVLLGDADGGMVE